MNFITPMKKQLKNFLTNRFILKSIEKKFKSRTENLSEIRKLTEDFLISNKVSKEDRDKIILAIDEACTNKIKHAYHYNSSKEILISFEINNQMFKAEISDWGEKFEPENIPIPNVNENYKAQKKGGYGMYLMKKLMDKVEYKFLENGENKIILLKKVTFESNGK